MVLTRAKEVWGNDLFITATIAKCWHVHRSVISIDALNPERIYWESPWGIIWLRPTTSPRLRSCPRERRHELMGSSRMPLPIRFLPLIKINTAQPHGGTTTIPPGPLKTALLSNNEASSSNSASIGPWLPIRIRGTGYLGNKRNSLFRPACITPFWPIMKKPRRLGGVRR